MFLISDLSRVISSLQIGQLDATYGTGVPYPVLDMEQLEKDSGGQVKPLKRWRSIRRADSAPEPTAVR